MRRSSVQFRSQAPSPVKWLWQDRLPLGELSLFAGREDIGKSTIAYTLALWLTRGTMKGEFFGRPRAVLVAATEDSWEDTIVRRLMATGANFDLVFRVDVTTADGWAGSRDLPADLPTVEEVATGCGAALLILDPLMSRLRRAIADGEAGPGERLPLAKDLAAVLGVNKNTVLRALHVLRDEGLLDFSRGRGITVAGTPSRVR